MKFGNLPDWESFLFNMLGLYVILQISQIGEENLSDFRIQILAALMILYKFKNIKSIKMHS